MRNELERLVARAAGLDPSAEQRRTWLGAVADLAEDWLGGLPDRLAHNADDDGARSALASAPIAEHPRPIAEVLRVFEEGVERPGATVSSPYFFGFIPTGAIYPSALADYLAAVVNKYSGKAFGAPGAARLDRTVVEWLAEVVGYPAGCGGDLTSGASVATLSAVVSARHAGGFPASEVHQQVVYVSPQTHAAIGKALRIAGLGDCVVSTVPVDDRFRMRTDALDDAIQRHHAAGLRPWLVVATAGSTDTGAVDPLDVIADIAQTHGCWFHVDAAYGGAFALTETGRARLRGIERSDSVVLDPHKGLFLPFGSGVVLVRDLDMMRAAFSATGAYLRDTDAAEDLSASDVSAELTRPFRGLRLWLPLQLIGVAAFRAALDEQLLLAQHAHAALATIDGIEVMPPPDLSVVTFRIVSANATETEADDATQRVVDAIQQDGRILLSSTEIDHRVVIRMAILNHRTHVEHVDRAIEIIGQHVARQIRSRDESAGAR